MLEDIRSIMFRERFEETDLADPRFKDPHIGAKPNSLPTTTPALTEVTCLAAAGSQQSTK